VIVKESVSRHALSQSNAKYFFGLDEPGKGFLN
jgi:hypothetical protein